MSNLILPFDRSKYKFEKENVAIPNGPPCVIVDTFGDEAIIESVADGTRYCVAKKDLIYHAWKYSGADGQTPFQREKRKLQ